MSTSSGSESVASESLRSALGAAPMEELTPMTTPGLPEPTIPEKSRYKAPTVEPEPESAYEQNLKGLGDQGTSNDTLHEDSDSKSGSQTELPDPSTSTIKPRILEEDDELWKGREEEGNKIRAYISHLESKASQLEYELEGDYIPAVSCPTTTENANKTNGWILECERKRIVQDQTGLDGLPQKDVGEVEEQRQRAQPTDGPILTRTRLFNHQYQLTSTKIVIRSPFVIEALRQALPAEGGSQFAELYLDPVTLEEPYMPLFHHWKEISQTADTLEGEAKEHLSFLQSTLRSECQAISNIAEQLLQGRISSIPFRALWLLYRPGTTVYHYKSGHLRAYLVKSVSGLTTLPSGSFLPLSLELCNPTADATGSDFVEAISSASISVYTGDKKFEELDYVPAGYLANEDQQHKYLVQRGKTYEELMRGSTIMEYRVNNACDDDTSRVVIDISMDPTRETVGQSDARHDPFIADPLYNPFPSARPVLGCSCSTCTNSRKKASAALPQGDTAVPGWKSVDKHLLLPPDISAFSLVKKTWDTLAIEHLRDPRFDVDMMATKLVIPADHRDIVTSLVNSYTEGDLKFSDFVKGKGRGLVILLHGSPGTGKTLTAECVAEQAKKPLYAITCGDLGVDSLRLETELRKIFERASKWGAVLLLDEADVFLQERDIRNLERNALVSVFLRELEYFDGILFLTTNRPGQLDEAFQSRIHITLAMPSLDAKAQLKVWQTFLREEIKSQTELVSFLKEIKKATAENALNGRQIRNCVRSARALAARGNQKLSVDHIRRVIDLTKKFSEYMKDLHGSTTDERQMWMGSRGK
ncbi:P-loop containing nucleoside triphosphate hydrolase protein [Lophiostoma macrostomum CBS 122681]|uniref:P-loop containing nucleoside triphosphate hydrolase protein n=1 Tax=Lophiostoma macrostomum CBS 122681 TaxID=1314788 RepID=A0A6A6SX20_9PLEO|nr:P-loop containing nucleoside triphosphate hydrolase protein [Lophiostoma macrostomum CBS 122681]